MVVCLRSWVGAAAFVAALGGASPGFAQAAITYSSVQDPLAGMGENGRPTALQALPQPNWHRVEVRLDWGDEPRSAARLGFEVAPALPDIAAALGLGEVRGAFVTVVRHNSAAHKAGLSTGDIVLAVGGHPVGSAADLERTLTEAPGLEFSVLRAAGGPAGIEDALAAAARAGSAEALMALGELRYFSFNGDRNYGAAEPYYVRAFEAGKVLAAFRLGSMYLDARGVDVDLAVATHWFKRAAASGLAEGQHALGIMYWSSRYWTGLALIGNEGEAVRLFSLAAGQGHSASYLMLGLAYHYGYGVEVDLAVAGAWYERAIAAGLPNAMFQRARMYAEEGADLPRALELFRRAAAAGDIEANRHLGLMYLRGQGVGLYPRVALDYFRPAAERDDIESMAMMGQILFNGYGVPRDIRAGLDWYFKAYQAGDADSGYALAYAYAGGLGVEKDFRKVAGFLLEAVRRGSVPAIEELETNADAWPVEVRQELQQLLLATGHYAGSIDGIFGPGTIRALNAVASSG